MAVGSEDGVLAAVLMGFLRKIVEWLFFAYAPESVKLGILLVPVVGFLTICAWVYLLILGLEHLASTLPIVLYADLHWWYHLIFQW